MKWRLHLYNQNKVALECFDAGKITDIKLHLWVSNYPYADGSITLDGVPTVSNMKLSYLNALGGIPTRIPDLEKLPLRVAVVNRARQRGRKVTAPKTLSREKVCELLQAETEEHKVFITDPRVLFLCYAVVLDRHPGLLKTVMAAPPTHAAARKILKETGLLRDPFFPEEIINNSFYDALTLFVDRIISDHAPEQAEILAAVRDKRPVRRPELVKVAGVFALSDCFEVLHRLKKYDPVTLEREPDNKYDPNAIRLYLGIPGTDRTPIGYLPKELAKELAPKLDWGSSISARIEEVHPKEKQILIALTSPKDIIPTEHLTLTWGDFPDRRHTATLNAKTRELTYRYRHDAFLPEETAFQLRFTPKVWKSIVEPLIQICNFPAWETAYRGKNLEYKQLLWKMTAKTPYQRTVSCGCNTAPVQFSHFLAFIRTCLDLNISKAFGEIKLTSSPAVTE